MSFTRNPKRFDVKKTKNSLVSKSEVKTELSYLDDILSSHRYFNREAKKALENKVKDIAYLLKHPKLSKSVNKLKILAEIDRKLKGIKGVDTSCLEDLIPEAK